MREEDEGSIIIRAQNFSAIELHNFIVNCEVKKPHGLTWHDWRSRRRWMTINGGNSVSSGLHDLSVQFTGRACALLEKAYRFGA